MNSGERARSPTTWLRPYRLSLPSGADFFDIAFARLIFSAAPNCIRETPELYCSFILLMPWKGPACLEAIEHSAAEPMPRYGVVYRCPVCRLELVLSRVTEKLVVAPSHEDEQPHKAPRKRYL